MYEIRPLKLRQNKPNSNPIKPKQSQYHPHFQPIIKGALNPRIQKKHLLVTENLPNPNIKDQGWAAEGERRSGITQP
jgi:hypothetical protein